MNKDTLANIVIKAVRQANSVIDSSYEFPEMGLRTNEEILFRDNVMQYCNACHDQGKTEERARHTGKILEYAASLYDDERGKNIPVLAKTLKRCRISTRIGLGFLSLAGIVINPLFILGMMFGIKSIAYDMSCKVLYGQPLEKELVEQYWEYEQKKDIAEELKKATQKDFNEAIFEHWDELMVALEDVSEDEKKRLLGRKSWE
ncbi:MAG: hypothetical protein QME12_06075 [Nanoarchaeota archaeon]|nr:hypothetical protein [Nanoarchaeota archaeon]